MVLLPNPQLSGSLSLPSMQVLDDSESAGRAQFVKSALICSLAPLLALEHNWLSER